MDVSFWLVPYYHSLLQKSDMIHIVPYEPEDELGNAYHRIIKVRGSSQLFHLDID